MNLFGFVLNRLTKTRLKPGQLSKDGKQVDTCSFTFQEKFLVRVYTFQILNKLLVLYSALHSVLLLHDWKMQFFSVVYFSLVHFSLAHSFLVLVDFLVHNSQIICMYRWPPFEALNPLVFKLWLWYARWNEASVTLNVY